MTIDSHGQLHRRWPSLSDSELHEELVEARDRLQQITGRRITGGVLPFWSL